MIIYKKIETIDDARAFGHNADMPKEMVSSKITIYFLGIPVYTSSRGVTLIGYHRI